MAKDFAKDMAESKDLEVAKTLKMKGVDSQIIASAFGLSIDQIDNL